MYSLEVKGVGVNWVRVVNTQRIRRKTRWRERGPQLPSFCQGWAGVFICRVQGVGDNICYTEKVGKWGKGKKKCRNLVLLVTDMWHCMRRGVW